LEINTQTQFFDTRVIGECDDIDVGCL
jgi:hypothetical protein